MIHTLLFIPVEFGQLRASSYRDPIFQQFGNPIPLKRPVMTAEPSVIIREFDSDDLFLIFASDGLWEQLSDQAVVKMVYKYPRAGIAKRLVRAALQEAAKKKEMRYADIKKIDKGIRRHFHDDISVIMEMDASAGMMPQSSSLSQLVSFSTEAALGSR